MVIKVRKFLTAVAKHMGERFVAVSDNTVHIHKNKSIHHTFVEPAVFVFRGG